MTIIPNQPFGLGDVIFCQTLVRRVANGNPIVWPVFPHFVDQLNRAYPDITFVDWTKFNIDYNVKQQYTFRSEKLQDECTVLPIRFAAEILVKGYPDWMRAKYELYGLDFETWREDAKWLRDGLKELQIKKLVTLYQPTCLVNRYFGSEGKLNIDIFDTMTPKGHHCIDMIPTKEFSLFDWQNVIQEASAIHTVSTSIIYLLEMLDLKAKEVHLYQRSIPGQTFAGIDYLLTRHKYIYHG